MKVFVTGSSGFIGSHVIRALLSRGHSVFILTPHLEQPWRLKDVFHQIDVKHGKLEDLRELRKTLSEIKVDACIHLAWYVEPGKYTSSMENLSSMKMTLNLYNELIQTGCKQIVTAGTCMEYAYSQDPLKEDSATGPSTLYAASKLSALLMGRQLSDLGKINFSWGRIFYPYGPKEDERRLVPSVINSILKGKPFPATQGNQVRDYIHVEDVALAFCLMAEKRVNEVINIASGTPITIREILETAGRLTDRINLIQFGAKPFYAWEPPTLRGDNQRLRSLGWEPIYSMESGMQNTIDWWKSNIQP